MDRVTKSPEERKNEIIETAQQLFIEKGFNQTKVSDIVKRIGVSQGIFYYYFKSKDEIIDEIVHRYIQGIKSSALEILDNRELSGIEKLQKMSEQQREANRRENNRIHLIKGVDVHERILRGLITDYVPLMQEAFSEKGKKDTLFLMEIFVAAGNVLFDPGILPLSNEERNERITFLIRFMEKSLDVPDGAFEFYKELMGTTG